MGDTAALFVRAMLTLKEESPDGAGLTDLHVFAEAPQPIQTTHESEFTTCPQNLLTEFDSKSHIVAPFAITATITSTTVLSDAMPTTPPYNNDTNYILSSVAIAAPSATPTATPPKDEFPEDDDMNSESDCPALEEESPYDALYRDVDFADDIPICMQPALDFSTPSEERREAITKMPGNARRHSIMGYVMTRNLPVAKLHTGESAAKLDGDYENQSGSLACRNSSRISNIEHANEEAIYSNGTYSLPVATPLRISDYLGATPADRETSTYSTPSDDSVTPQGSSNLQRHANRPSSTAATTPARSPPAIKVGTTKAVIPERRTSKRLSLATSTAMAKASAKQNTASTAKSRLRSKSVPLDSEVSSPVPRRVTRRSGLSCDLSISMASPKGAVPRKRRRRESEKDTEAHLPRELRRLQDTKEYSHVDDEPVIYTVWSNGRYVPSNAAGEPLVDESAARKTRLAKEAEEAEELRLAEEEAARAKEAEEKAAAEASRSFRKRVKTWSLSGLYAGQETPSHPAAGLTLAERKAFAKLPELARTYPKNKTLPMPIYNGLRMLIQGRDFKMPFDVFNPLPPGQPKPVKYGRFSKNRFVGDAHSIWKKNPNYDDLQSKCVCKPATGCDEDCQNRIMLYECNDEICNVGSERCSNREFQRLAERTASKNSFHIGVEVFKTLDRGHGIRANRAFRPGQIIMEYIGEIITEEESDRRMNELYKNNDCYYLMSFDQSLIIDGTSGSIARFVNHSCSPNCRMIKWIVSGQPRIALFAGDRPIMTGEELTYDYNFDPYSAKNVQGCLCGAENCRGVLGPRKSEKVVKTNAGKTSGNGASNSTKRKHDSFSLDDDDKPDGPVKKKTRLTDPPPASTRSYKPTKTAPPQKAVMTTKAALEALAATDARVARLTKASHVARAGRQAKASEKGKTLQTSKKPERVPLSNTKATRAAAAAAVAAKSRAKITKTNGDTRKTNRVAKKADDTRRVGRVTESAAASKRAATPPNPKSSRASDSQNLSPQATPMALAVAKVNKKATTTSRVPDGLQSRKVTGIAGSGKVTKPSAAKAGTAVTKKLAALATAGGKEATTAKLASAGSPIARGKGRSKLAARDASRMSAPSVSAYTNEGADEEEELAAQFATEAAANPGDAAEPTDTDNSEDESTMQFPRKRKLTKSQKLRAKRQHVAAQRSVERASGINVPRRGPGRPRKQSTIAEPDLDDTAASSDTQVAADSTGPVPANSIHRWPAANLAKPASTAPAVKVKVRYGAARRGDVEEFKAARARALARMEQIRAMGGDAGSILALTEDSDSPESSPERDLPAEDVIYVAPSSYLQV